jgi:hypothetical protein
MINHERARWTARYSHCVHCCASSARDTAAPSTISAAVQPLLGAITWHNVSLVASMVWMVQFTERMCWMALTVATVVVPHMLHAWQRLAAS